MLSVLAQTTSEVIEFNRPDIDWHAFAPELIVLGWGALVTIIDLVGLERSRRFMPGLTGLGFLLAMIPVLTLWDLGEDLPRTLFDGAYVVDHYSLVLKGLFLISAYLVVLISTVYMSEGDYYDSEYYQLISAAVLGMLVMSSARDLVSIFVALELVSIPAYLMAAWRKRDLKSNEAGLKYMLMGVFASGLMLYGMSMLYGAAADTRLSVIGESLADDATSPFVIIGALFTVIGFAFKVSAVPFHTWAPDTYEGAPTPLTAFLAVSSKTAGFVGLIAIVLFALPEVSNVVQPLMWILSAATMTIGNLIALRQTNVVRMLAYSGIAQAGYMLAPLAVYGDVPDSVQSSIVTYLLIYAAMNLGAFSVVIVAARKTRSGEIESFGGMFRYAPGLTAAMTAFLFSLTGIPPMGGWFAKFQIFNALVEPGTTAGYALAIIAAVNSVIAAFYYLNVAKFMWFLPAPDGDHAPIRIPPTLIAAIAVTLLFTFLSGVALLVPDITDFVELAAR
ncbi:MAG: NADH-quinone oxidoreductase subunit N [Acidimicrobiales bacterium]